MVVRPNGIPWGDNKSIVQKTLNHKMEKKQKTKNKSKRQK
jgi:hypothetical protein